MSNCDNLQNAKKSRNDEFYTPIDEIEDIMLRVDRTAFKDKIVYCPCDRAIASDKTPVSNFVVYFKEHFLELGLSKLIISWLEPDISINNYQVWGILDDSLKLLEDEHINGDFRSSMVLNLIDTVDIIVTNPPFSLFRLFFQCIKDKEFLIIGSNIACSYSNIFPYIEENNCFTLRPRAAQHVKYNTPSGEEKEVSSYWYTNLYFAELYDPNRFIPTKTYLDSDYKCYDGTDIINCDSINLIPKDFDGVMGVPVSFLGIYNPNQFNILGIKEDNALINGKRVFVRILIKYKNKNINTKIPEIKHKPKHKHIVDFTRYLTKYLVEF